MKKFKKYILEEIDRTALPPPTVIYPKDINPEMLDPSELPMYRFNLPPNIDWRALDQEFLRYYIYYIILLQILRIYGHVPSSLLLQYGIPDDIELGVDYESYVIDRLIEKFHQLYPNATQQQYNTFIEQFTQYTNSLGDLWDQYNSIIINPSPSDVEAPAIPRNQPKPKPNLPRKPFWPGHADGVVG